MVVYGTRGAPFSRRQREGIVVIDPSLSTDRRSRIADFSHFQEKFFFLNSFQDFVFREKRDDRGFKSVD